MIQATLCSTIDINSSLTDTSPTVPSIASIDLIGGKMDQHIHPWVELDVDLDYLINIEKKFINWHLFMNENRML